MQKKLSTGSTGPSFSQLYTNIFLWGVIYSLDQDSLNFTISFSHNQWTHITRLHTSQGHKAGMSTLSIIIHHFYWAPGSSNLSKSTHQRNRNNPSSSNISIWRPYENFWFKIHKALNKKHIYVLFNLIIISYSVKIIITLNKKIIKYNNNNV